MDSHATRSLIVPLPRSYLCNTKPPVCKEFNNPDTSDLVIRSGDRTFHVHRLILSCASPVFRRMLEGNWKERQSAEIHLNEDDEELVEAFLHFMYSGHIIMLSSNIVRYYSLADKYNVRSLTSICRRHILEGLQVTAAVLEDCDMFVLSTCRHSDAPEVASKVAEKVPCFRDTCEWFSDLPTTHCYRCRLDQLSAAMHFSLMSVMELVNSSSRRIASAAYHSLLVSLLKINHTTGSWATAANMPLPLLLRVLNDDNFFAEEDAVFDLSFEWLQSNACSVAMTSEVILEVLSAVRLPLMSRENLYRIQTQLRRASWMTGELTKSLDERLRTAERYQLYASLPEAVSQEDWSGTQFTHRNGCEVFRKVVSTFTARNASRGSHDGDDSA